MGIIFFWAKPRQIDWAKLYIEILGPLEPKTQNETRGVESKQQNWRMVSVSPQEQILQCITQLLFLGDFRRNTTPMGKRPRNGKARKSDISADLPVIWMVSRNQQGL